MSNKLKIVKEEPGEPWYSEGLEFECTGCGECCTGGPGYCWVTEEECGEIAAYLKISVKELGRKYLRTVHGRLSLTERSKNYDCVFLENKRCTIYPVRPKQCRTYPWWPEVLKDKKSWEEEAIRCEGIRCGAQKVSFEKIQEQLSIQIKQ